MWLLFRGVSIATTEMQATFLEVMNSKSLLAEEFPNILNPLQLLLLVTHHTKRASTILTSVRVCHVSIMVELT